jgi:hypothetical protein
VVGDRGRGEVERVGQVADADLAAGVGGDEREQPQPHRIAEGFEGRGEPLGLIGVERLGHQGHAAVVQIAASGDANRLLRHAPILADV